MKKGFPKIEPDFTADGVRAGRSNAGLGLFATRAFAKGERIIQYVGYQVPTGDQGPNNLYIFNVTKDWDIDGSPRWNTARYANYSCLPNAEAVNDDDKIFLEARRKILPGEEITYDYGKEYFEDILVKEKGGCLCQGKDLLHKKPFKKPAKNQIKKTQ